MRLMLLEQEVRRHIVLEHCANQRSPFQFHLVLIIEYFIKNSFITRRRCWGLQGPVLHGFLQS
jgi:hypothetical protein